MKRRNWPGSLGKLELEQPLEVFLGTVVGKAARKIIKLTRAKRRDSSIQII